VTLKYGKKSVRQAKIKVLSIETTTTSPERGKLGLFLLVGMEIRVNIIRTLRNC
jgi:hypothetical protein